MQVTSLVLGYACLIGLMINIGAHLGWIAAPVGILRGAGARWLLTLGGGVCFVLAWYLDRLNAKRAP